VRSVLSEAFHLLGEHGTPKLGALLRRGALLVAFTLTENLESVVKLIEKYSNVPMGFAHACLVRMTETLDDPVILTTDQDFRVYRRHSRQVVPCATPE
jgi:predicted nucleic acid-binding protein